MALTNSIPADFAKLVGDELIMRSVFAQAFMGARPYPRYDNGVYRHRAPTFAECFAPIERLKALNNRLREARNPERTVRWHDIAITKIWIPSGNGGSVL